jgi:hypothetical protein
VHKQCPQERLSLFEGYAAEARELRRRDRRRKRRAAGFMFRAGVTIPVAQLIGMQKRLESSESPEAVRAWLSE